MSNPFLFRPGTVTQKCHVHNSPSAVLQSISDNEGVPDMVHIITLREAALDEARDEAVSTALRIDELTPLTFHLANTKFNMQREFVRVEKDAIVIAVDAPVINQQAISTGMGLLIEIEDFDVCNTYHFGKCVDTAQPMFPVDKTKKS